MQNNKKNGFAKGTLFVIIMMAISTIGVIATGGGLVREFTRKQGTVSFEHQIKTLNQVEQSINTLKAFVVEQRENLRHSEQAISQLKEEEKKLKPIVQANWEVIDALFALQAERLSRNNWLERALGFFLGVLSSLIKGDATLYLSVHFKPTEIENAIYVLKKNRLTPVSTLSNIVW